MKRYLSVNDLKRLLVELGYKNVFSALTSLAFYKLRIEELEAHKDEFPEPYHTQICNILANGRIKP